jgi:hypothetical protein
MPDDPPQVVAFQDALSRLPDAYDVASTVQCLWGVTPEALSFFDFGHLPHAAIRWAGGGQQDQTLAQFEFWLRPSSAGWRSLEFISWWVRDQARGGTNIQLRPFGLPPIAGKTVQLGHTLRFHIDLFCVAKGDDLSPVLALVQKLADDLVDTMRMYQNVLFEEGAS